MGPGEEVGSAPRFSVPSLIAYIPVNCLFSSVPCTPSTPKTCPQFGVAEEKMMEKLWGDNFFDPATKKWTRKMTTSATCKCALNTCRSEVLYAQKSSRKPSTSGTCNGILQALKLP